jgi:hypothetical protein
MAHTTITATPTIVVAIGRQAQQFHAVVTTAPPPLDAPATLTLYDATLADVSGLAACPPVLHQERADSRARGCGTAERRSVNARATRELRVP